PAKLAIAAYPDAPQVHASGKIGAWGPYVPQLIGGAGRQVVVMQRGEGAPVGRAARAMVELTHGGERRGTHTRAGLMPQAGAPASLVIDSASRVVMDEDALGLWIGCGDGLDPSSEVLRGPGGGGRL